MTRTAALGSGMGLRLTGKGSGTIETRAETLQPKAGNRRRTVGHFVVLPKREVSLRTHDF